MTNNPDEVHENPKNMAYYCKGCNPEPKPHEGPMADLVGKWVKVRFTDLNAGVAGEHMWVKVEAVSGETAVGYLDNVPFHVHNIKFRDPVTVERSRIEDIC